MPASDLTDEDEEDGHSANWRSHVLPAHPTTIAKATPPPRGRWNPPDEVLLDMVLVGRKLRGRNLDNGPEEY